MLSFKKATIRHQPPFRSLLAEIIHHVFLTIAGHRRPFFVHFPYCTSPNCMSLTQCILDACDIHKMRSNISLEGILCWRERCQKQQQQQASAEIHKWHASSRVMVLFFVLSLCVYVRGYRQEAVGIVVADVAGENTQLDRQNTKLIKVRISDPAYSKTEENKQEKRKHAHWTIKIIKKKLRATTRKTKKKFKQFFCENFWYYLYFRLGVKRLYVYCRIVFIIIGETNKQSGECNTYNNTQQSVRPSQRLLSEY